MNAHYRPAVAAARAVQHAAARQSPVGLGIEERITAIDWEAVALQLDAQGSAVIERLVAAAECEALAGLYADDALFRSRVVMAQHGFGRGEYRYFNLPRESSARCELRAVGPAAQAGRHLSRRGLMRPNQALAADPTA